MIFFESARKIQNAFEKTIDFSEWTHIYFLSLFNASKLRSYLASASLLKKHAGNSPLRR